MDTLTKQQLVWTLVTDYFRGLLATHIDDEVVKTAIGLIARELTENAPEPAPAPEDMEPLYRAVRERNDLWHLLGAESQSTALAIVQELQATSEDYSVLRQACFDAFDPADDDIAEVEILRLAIVEAGRMLRNQCQCTTDAPADYEPRSEAAQELMQDAKQLAEVIDTAKEQLHDLSYAAVLNQQLETAGAFTEPDADHALPEPSKLPESLNELPELPDPSFTPAQIEAAYTYARENAAALASKAMSIHTLGWQLVSLFAIPTEGTHLPDYVRALASQIAGDVRREYSCRDTIDYIADLPTKALPKPVVAAPSGEADDWKALRAELQTVYAAGNNVSIGGIPDYLRDFNIERETFLRVVAEEEEKFGMSGLKRLGKRLISSEANSGKRRN